MPPRAKKQKIPKMRKPRLGRVGRAGRTAASKPGQKQTQKLVVNVGDKPAFAFPQQQGLTLQDLINFEATKGQRLGTREEPLAVKESVSTETKVKPNLETLGSILMKSEPVITEAGSLEALKPVMKPKPVLTEASSSFELNKSKPVKVTNQFLNELSNEIDAIIKEKPKPKPVLTEASSSFELNKSQMKPKPVLTEASSSFELNKSKPKQIVEEVFNKPITTKSLFEQIAKTQPPPEAYAGLEPPKPSEEEKPKIGRPKAEDKETQTAVIKGGKVVKIADKVAEAKATAEAEAKKAARKAKKEAKAAADEAYGLAYTLGSADAIDAGAKIGIKEGIPLGRDIQNQYVMDLTKGEFGRFPGMGVRLKPTEQNQPASSSSSVPNFA